MDMNLRRQPAFWAALVVAAITAGGTFWPALGGWDVLVQNLFIAVWAVVTAWHVRPIAPTVISAAAVALFDIAARFGWQASDLQVGSIEAVLILGVTGVVIWPNSTPKLAPAPAQGRVSRADL